MSEDQGVGFDVRNDGASETVSRRAFLRLAAWLPVPVLVVPVVVASEPAEAQSMLGLIIGAAGGFRYRGGRRRYRGGGGWRRRGRRHRGGGGGGGSSGREAPELIR